MIIAALSLTSLSTRDEWGIERERAAAEHATYRIEAIDGGIGGGKAGDSFAFIVFFDPDEAPVNCAIFGPEATFTGTMVSGGVAITNPLR